MTLEEFIQDTIIDALGIMVNTPKLKYLSFGVMSSAIEFLGACLDTEGFHVSDRSRMRFEMAMKSLSTFCQYRKYIGSGKRIDLYKELRSGMIHALLPQSRVELTQRAELNGGGKHLQEHILKNRNNNPKRLLLVCEDLYDDIRGAANELITELKTNKYHHKATEPFLATDIEIARTP